MLRVLGMLSCVLAILSAAGSCASQTTSAVTHSNATSQAEAAPLETIAPGDLVQISVFGHPELSRQSHVANDGKAQMSLLGEVALAGLTEAEAATLITNQLRDRNFLLHPQVTVEIKESASQNVSVLGEVQHPGAYPIAAPRTLLDVLSLAGGMTTTAGSQITIERHSSSEGSTVVNIKASDNLPVPSLDALVYPGDSIIVPRAGIVYVLGDVARPGGFVMQNNGGITLLQAIAQAGGPLATASAGQMILLRKDKGDYEVTKKLDFRKIVRGHGADIELRANDILFVPNSRVKGALRTSGSIASSLSTVALYGIIQ